LKDKCRQIEVCDFNVFLDIGTRPVLMILAEFGIKLLFYNFVNFNLKFAANRTGLNTGKAL